MTNTKQQQKREGMFGVSIDDESCTQFEEEQKEYGTQVALFNFVFLIVDSILKNLGVGKFSVAKVNPEHIPATEKK